MNHIAKKSLGQNFLKSDAALAKIIRAANLSVSDTVLEIGPGQGALTRELLASAGKVVAIEKDDGLFAYLQETFAQETGAGKLVLVHGDVMDVATEGSAQASQGLQPGEDQECEGHDGRPERSSAARESLAMFVHELGTYKLVANIPYNLTGAIIEKFLSAKFQPSQMVLLVQKEVAERIVARDKKTGGQGKESILSIAVKAYGNPSYVSTVKAGSFAPVPKVDSAIISITDISRAHFKNPHHEQVFFQVMKAGFAHKRKTLAGNLKNILEPEIVEVTMDSVGLSKMVRAEDLSITMWLALADAVYHATYGH